MCSADGCLGWYTHKQPKDKGSPGPRFTSGGAFMQEREFDAPRTCKGPCQSEKLAAEFIAKDGKNMVQWCKDCRQKRFEYLKKQRRAKKPPAPTIRDVIDAAQEVYMARSMATADAADERLRRLQEDYKWTSVRR